MLSLLTLLPPLALAGWHLNWLGRRRPWPVSTGWDRLPDALRPDEDTAAWPQLYPGWPRLFWLGHSGFLLDWDGTRLLLDPNAADRINVTRRVMTLPAAPSTWGHCHAALISHAHHDHLVPATLAAVPRIDHLVIPSGSHGYVRGIRAEAPRLVALAEGETRDVAGVEVTSVPAAHNGARHHPWRSAQRASGYMLRRAGITVYFAGDTAYDLDFEALRQRHRPDVGILPIGAFSPRRPLRIHHMSPEEAVEAAVRLGVGRVVPCHFGTFTLSLDAPGVALPRFAHAAARRGVHWAMPRFLADPLPSP